MPPCVLCHVTDLVLTRVFDYRKSGILSKIVRSLSSHEKLDEKAHIFFATLDAEGGDAKTVGAFHEKVYERNAWMKSKESSVQNFDLCKSYVVEFSPKQEEGFYVVIIVDGKKLYVVKPSQLLIVPMAPVRVAILPSVETATAGDGNPDGAT
eukprot:GHVS01101431.1.p1 GENE.GHVS01101431.1~~GHVS01101431.1.p1  ORF type:complete len:152 (+),score=16.62 GHVS01101431.1:2-457(+)